MATKLSTPRIRIVLPPFAGADPDTDEGVEHTVRALNMDLVAYDRDRGRYQWPMANEVPLLWASYLGWKVATRLGVIPAMKLAEWEAMVWSVEMIPDPEDSTSDGDGVDPTRTGPGPA